MNAKVCIAFEHRRLAPAASRAVAVAASTLIAAAAAAQPSRTAELGRIEYESNCASCHGLGGRGDGPLQPYLVQPPADLTTIARRHGGSFPTELVWEMIDGRSGARVGTHGTAEMPVWGNEYRAQAQANPRTAGQAEQRVRDRIVALLAYLEQLQKK